MIFLLDRNQIVSNSVYKSEIHHALSEIAKYISLSIVLKIIMSAVFNLIFDLLNEIVLPSKYTFKCIGLNIFIHINEYKHINKQYITMVYAGMQKEVIRLIRNCFPGMSLSLQSTGESFT